MDKKLYDLMDWREIEAVVYGECLEPFHFLGMQKIGKDTLLQCFLPDALNVKAVFTSEKDNSKTQVVDMELMDETGFFAAFKPKSTSNSYLLEVHYEDRTEIIPYAYSFIPEPDVKEMDLFFQGKYEDISKILGAKETTLNGTKGVLFSVWAPNANHVSVIGDFNAWDARVHQMQFFKEYGIFMLFLPGIGSNTAYQYEIKYSGYEPFRKNDPCELTTDCNGVKVSVTSDASDFRWEDSDWQKNAVKTVSVKKPITSCELSIQKLYETITDLSSAEIMIKKISDCGFSHVELISDDQIITMNVEASRVLKYFINLCHKFDVAVILEWNAAYFKDEEYGLSGFDGTKLYEYPDVNKATHPIKGRLLYDLESPAVISYLKSSLYKLLKDYHADGIRFTALADMLYLDYMRVPGQWKPNKEGGCTNLEAVSFIREVNSQLFANHKGIIKISDMNALWKNITGSVQEGGLGFDYQFNTSVIKNLSDFLKLNSNQKRYQIDLLTDSMEYGYNEQFVLPNMDLGEISVDEHLKATQMQLSLAYLYMHPGKKMLISHEYLKEEGFATFCKNLNKFYLEHPSLYIYDNLPKGFSWNLSDDTDGGMVSFYRKSDKSGEVLLVVANFSENDRAKYLLGVSQAGSYHLIYSSSQESLCKKSQANKLLSSEIGKGVYKNYVTLSIEKMSVEVYSYVPFTQKELDQIAENKKQRLLKETEKQRLLSEKEALTKEFQKQQDKIMKDAISQAKKEIKLLEKQYLSNEKVLSDKISKLKLSNDLF